MLEAIDLKCVRGNRVLFSSLKFMLRGGELLRVAGVNGSGKTSLLRLLCGLLIPAEGEVRWRGENIRALGEEYFRELLYVGHANAVKDELTPAENLTIACTLAGMNIGKTQVGDALCRLGLAGYEDLPVKVLSQGQRRRVALARLALSATLPLWVVDEPFTALDADAVEEVQTLIAEHVARGAAVVLTTHQEVEIPAVLKQRIVLGLRAD
jgi:heme exporter protein A